MELKERFSEFARDYCKMTINAFERACQVPTGTIAKCGDSITTKNLTRILQSYPELDVLWLLGLREIPNHRKDSEGVMSFKTSVDPTENQCDKEIAYLKGQLRAKDDMIALLTDRLSKKI